MRSQIKALTTQAKNVLPIIFFVALFGFVFNLVPSSAMAQTATTPFQDAQAVLTALGTSTTQGVKDSTKQYVECQNQAASDNGTASTSRVAECEKLVEEITYELKQELSAGLQQMAVINDDGQTFYWAIAINNPNDVTVLGHSFRDNMTHGKAQRVLYYDRADLNNAGANPASMVEQLGAGGIGTNSVTASIDVVSGLSWVLIESVYGSAAGATTTTTTGVTPGGAGG